jgi:RND family efflux transporter MFP subunit
MKKRIQRTSIVVIGLMGLVSCGDQKNPSQQAGAPAVQVNTYTVMEGGASFFDQFPGTVTALNQVDIRPQVSGYITGIFFKEGDRVQKGQRLYSIDPQQYQGAYEQSKANLDVSKANLSKAQQDADRYEDLSKQDAVARQTLEHAQADLESAKKQVEAAKANVSAVQTSLRYTTIYAPFTGTIGISQVKLGASVSPGQTLLNTISSDDPIGVDVAIDDKQISRFIQLQKKTGGKKDSTFTLMLPGNIPYPESGHISFLDRAVDPQTGTITTRLIFSNPQKILKPGLTCNLLVRSNSPFNSILIPYKAVVEQMGEYFVFVIDSSKAIQRKVSLGSKINDLVVVNNGLKPNDRIVSDGVQKLHDGSLVKLPAPQLDSTQSGSAVKTK